MNKNKGISRQNTPLFNRAPTHNNNNKTIYQFVVMKIYFNNNNNIFAFICNKMQFIWFYNTKKKMLLIDIN